jgi:hypothetical protein
LPLYHLVKSGEKKKKKGEKDPVCQRSNGHFFSFCLLKRAGRKKKWQFGPTGCCCWIGRNQLQIAITKIGGL